MTVLHSGTTVKYSENWDSIFGGKPKKKAGAKTSGKKKATPKKKASPKKKGSTAKRAKTKKKSRR